MRVLVVGGTRFMGRETVLALGGAGHDVTVFNRGNHRVEWPFHVQELKGDRTVEHDVERLRDIDFDAVIDFAAYSGRHVELLLGVLPNDAHAVLISSGAVYEPVPEMPWAEDVPYGPWEFWGDYGRGKVEAEQTLRAREPSRGSTVILRLPYVLGPQNYADREEFILNRLLDDELILVPGDGEAVIQFISARQVARAIANIVEQLAGGLGPIGEALGPHVLNLGSPECLSTLSGLIEVCGRMVDKTPRTRNVPAAHDPGAGSPLAADRLIFPFPNRTYILDTRQAERAGILPPRVSLADMINESYEALMRSPDRRKWTRTEGERSALDKSSGMEGTWT